MVKRKLKKRTSYQKQKKKTDDWCSRYIRIRDAVKFSCSEYGQCYTCGKIVHVKKANSGHFKSRGIGGGSGIYFDERAIHLQCIQCNGFCGGKPEEYEEHLIRDYGREVVEELKRKHKINKYTLMDLFGLELYFKLEVEQMCMKYNIKKWW
uniref:Putative lambda recombination protein n=1 Tax=viral metagenome TaxID=1070528 RepID=A0A6M3KLV7_9ZZZZ